MTIIIVEGLDRCGKSTIVEHIRKKIVQTPKVLTIHSSSPPKGIENQLEWAQRYYNFLLWNSSLLSPNGVIIHDRSYLGEYVYGSLYRGLNCEWVFTELEPRILLQDVKLILCTDTIDNRLSREDGLSQAKNVSFMEKEYDLFVEAFNTSALTDKIHLHNLPLEVMIQKATDFLGVINV